MIFSSGDRRKTLGMLTIKKKVEAICNYTFIDDDYQYLDGCPSRPSFKNMQPRDTWRGAQLVKHLVLVQVMIPWSWDGGGGAPPSPALLGVVFSLCPSPVLRLSLMCTLSIFLK